MTGDPHAYKVPWLLRVMLIFRTIMGHNVIVDPELIASFELEPSLPVPPGYPLRVRMTLAWSNLSNREALPTVTVADLGCWSIKAISPVTSPGSMMPTCCPP